MKNLKMFCLSLYSHTLQNIKKLKYVPVGLGEENFSSQWFSDKTKKNISYKNRYYGEYTFHYWLWRNYLDKIPDNNWVGFCTYRRYWANNNRLNSEQLTKKVNNKNFQSLVLNKINSKWKDYDVILGEEKFVNKIKFMKIIKNGGLLSILKNVKSFIKNDGNIKFHFDVFHGNGLIDKAIKVLDIKERDDFRHYVNTNKSFTRDNLFMCKSKKILNLYYKSIFGWLNRCENIFGFNLHKWHQIRIYGFLAERYVGYWFKKYTNSIEWPIIFFDTHKNKVKF
jgi:hypothetical protein